MEQKILHHKKGFTLLETLVTIAIMVVAVGAAFAMGQKSLSASFLAKNQTIASFMAAEGLELVRNIRDNVALYNIAEEPTPPIGWLEPLESLCIAPASCDIDGTVPDLSIDVNGTLTNDAAIHGCSDGACRMKLKPIATSGGPTGLGAISVYSSFGVDGTNSIFYRSIQITEQEDPNSDKKEAIVTVTVKWLGEEIKLTETLTNWHQ